MTAHQLFLAGAAVLYSTLYLALVVVVGLATGNPLAWKLGLASLGLCYLCFVFQYYGGVHAIYLTVANTAVACSIVAGVLAGVALLVKS